MAKLWAILLLVGLCGSVAGASIVQADGLRFGLWRFPGLYFNGPRYDGPRYEGPIYDGPGPAYQGPDDEEPHFRRYGSPNPPRPQPLEAGPPGPKNMSPNGEDPRLPRRAFDSPPPGPRTCYSQAETRERIVAEKLREPFALMRSASAYARADALAGKLCRWNDVDIYEISLLRPDGRVIHVFMNAATGQVVGALNAR